jgi:hypothetical protein
MGIAFLAQIILPFVVAAAVSSMCAFLWRGQLSSAIGFFFFGFLLMLGLHRAIQAVAEIAKLFFGPVGYTLVGSAAKPEFIGLVGRQLTIEAITLLVVSVSVGVPLLVVARNVVKA